VQNQNAIQNEYVSDLNVLSDLSPEEVAQLKGGLPNPSQQTSSAGPSVSSELRVGSAALPSSIDWRQYGVVTSVKYQGNCGCCWVFSSTAYVESFLIIKTNTTYDLSEEYTLECTNGSSCNGGHIEVALAVQVNGVPNETTYPYMGTYYNGTATPTSSGICSTNQKVALPIATAQYDHNNTSTYVKTLLVNSPIAVGIYAEDAFTHYKSGTYGCASVTTESQLDHAVLIVGYNEQGDYIIKNSWSTSWGD